MKKFQFRLEPLLKLRQYKERQAQMELAKAQTAFRDSRMQVAKVQARVESARKGWEGALQKGMWENEFRMHVSFLEGLGQESLRALEHQAAMEKLVMEKQRELLQATTARKTMDLLKDGRMAEYMEEAGKAQQKESDELANVHRSSRERLES